MNERFVELLPGFPNVGWIFVTIGLVSFGWDRYKRRWEGSTFMILAVGIVVWIFNPQGLIWSVVVFGPTFAYQSFNIWRDRKLRPIAKAMVQLIWISFFVALLTILQPHQQTPREISFRDRSLVVRNYGVSEAFMRKEISITCLSDVDTSNREWIIRSTKSKIEPVRLHGFRGVC